MLFNAENNRSRSIRTRFFENLQSLLQHLLTLLYPAAAFAPGCYALIVTPYTELQYAKREVG